MPPSFPIQVSEAAGTATVQAGVPQRILLDYLAAHRCAALGVGGGVWGARSRQHRECLQLCCSASRWTTWRLADARARLRKGVRACLYQHHECLQLFCAGVPLRGARP